MSIFRRTRPGPADLARVKAELGALAEAMRRQDERAEQLAEALAAQPDGAALAGRVDALDVAISSRDGDSRDDVVTRLDAITERLDAIEHRITAVSTELANQVSELGGEIEALQQRPPGEPVDEEVLDELRDAQTRLASEQARYQIAFRTDLARLAEQLRRPDDVTRRRGA